MTKGNLLSSTIDGGIMTRRTLIGWIVSSALALLGSRASAQSSNQQAEVKPFNFDKFPFRHITTTGVQAMAELDRQKADSSLQPVILGADADLDFIVGNLWVDGVPPDPTPILKRADILGDHFDIHDFRKRAYADFIVRQKERGQYKAGDEIFDENLPEAGDWPAEPEIIMPTVNTDILTGNPLARVYIALVPTKSNSDIPAFLSWGGWNANPPPEVHVAMLRKWNKEYSAELIGMTGDVLNMRVKKRPTSKDEAMALALEQFRYCEDLVLQGTQSLEALAGALMVSDYWYFWWD